jgi:hypothetical protein
LDIGKNSQAKKCNDIHQNPLYSGDSVSSLLHTEKLVSKRLGESPVDPIVNLPVSTVVFETLPVPETSVAAPASEELKGMPDLTESGIQKKTHGIIDEFLSNRDLQDAVECVKEEMHKMTIVRFIENGLNIVIERKPSARTEFGKLLRELLSKQLISRDVLIEGFRIMLEGASDIIVDVPQLFENLAQTLKPILEHDDQCLYVVKDMEQLVSADITTRGRLMAAVLAEIAKTKDKEKAARV